MKTKKISIVIPAYNTEKYIKKCLDSIINQTYKNKEIIIIDDASTDNTLLEIEKYHDNACVKIIKNKENKGQAYSRNKAIKIASGDYIGFIDSDDYVEEDYYEKLINSLNDEESDIAICDIKMINENNKSEEIHQGCQENISKINIINNGIAASPCNKIFKKELIIKYPFIEGKINEDIAAIIPAVVHAKKVSYVPNNYYYYIQRKNSTQNSSFNDKRFDIFYTVDECLNRIKDTEDYKDISQAIIYNQLIALLLYVFPKIKDSKQRKHYLKKYHELIKKYDINNNSYYQEFLNKNPKKQRIFFSTITKTVSKGQINVTNNLFAFLNWYQIKRKRRVTKVITIDDLIIAATENQKKSDLGLSISVILPNYNYEQFLIERLYSILIQEIKIKELIILDDCSKDNSRDLIDKICIKLEGVIPVIKEYNTLNSGTPFAQWQKGLKLAKGDYIWIAEVDDYCDKKMLKELTKPLLKNQDIYLSYCDTSYINKDGQIILKTIKPEIDILHTGHWDKPYINNGKDEIKEYAYLNCTIANVSSCLIKKDNYEELLNEAKTYKQAGDWLFYINVMERGKIAYANKTYNYYRMHGNNVSSVTKKENHLKEIKRIHSYIADKYGLTKEQKEHIQARYSFLERVWDIKKGE